MKPVLNFEHPADAMYMIEPFGEHPNAEAGIIQVIDPVAAKAIVNRFNSEAAKPNFPGMLIDREHFKWDASRETTAYGWLTRLESRDDGIYGQIRWTATGQAAVDGGDYRFFSTEYDPPDMIPVSTANPGKLRPIRLGGLTLTNAPNNRGGMPITNSKRPLVASGEAPTNGPVELSEAILNSSLYRSVMGNRTNQSGAETAMVKNRTGGSSPIVTKPRPISNILAFDARLRQIMEREGITDERKALATAIREFPDEFDALPEDCWFKTTRPLPVENRSVRNKSTKPIPANYPKDPAQAFNMKARQVMTENDLDWPDAYRTVRKNFPEFWDAIPDTDPFKMALVDGICKNRNRAAARFHQSVTAYRNRIKVDYETAFAACKDILPDVYAQMTEEL